MILLTTLAETTSRKSLWQAVEGYMTRWRVEDAIRFVKQSYNLEDIRVLKYRRLKNMVALLLAVIYFNCTWLAGRLRYDILTNNITNAAKRIYGWLSLSITLLPTASGDYLRAMENGTATSRQTPNLTRSDWFLINDRIFLGKSTRCTC